MNIENNKSIVESALLQIKAVEDAISENAKGILASTMKEEISELVRESLVGSKKTKLREQEEQDPELEVDVEDEVDVEEPEMGPEDMDMNPEEEEPAIGNFEMPDEGDNEEMPPLNMTNAPMSDVLKVFRAMGDQDGIIVAKDQDDIYLKDGENEYIIRTGADETNTQEMMGNQMDENVLYELVLEDENPFGDLDEQEDEELDEMDDKELDEQEDEELDEMYDEEANENIFSRFKIDKPNFDEEENVYELDVNELESVMESFKSKGIGMGKAGNGMSKSSVNVKGFKDSMSNGTKSEKTGKGPKFKYPSIKHGVTETEMEEEEFNEWEEETTEGMMDTPETTESSRTLGVGKSHGRNGLPKPRTYSSHVRTESVNKEMSLLKEKNEEYKKALDFFRTKLNEVAVFNSNLAYSTRLFTEHSTTKQEKINILRRFDTVESLKESKNLYQSIKKDLDGKGTPGEMVTESIQRKVIKTPSNGSASNLIESKTYENPQFMRMKDLMTKIK
jgi:hypothetical protein